MIKTSYELIPADLLLLQKHIKLGKSHLETCLSSQEIDSIFEFIKLPSKTEKELSASSAEIAGQISLVINTILTGILGFWLGLSGLLHLNVTSKFVLVSVLTVAFGVGLFIGVQSIRFKKKSTEAELDKMKLRSLELQIVKMLNRNRERELKEEIDEIISLLKGLKIHIKSEVLTDPKSDFQKLCLEWVSHVKGADQIRSLLEEKIDAKSKYESDMKNFKKIANKLSDCPILPPRAQAKFSRLMIELIPTLLGGAASLFVYIGGTRTQIQERGNSFWISFLERPETQMAQLIFVISITLYFAASFVYMKLKSFKREEEMTKVETHLIEEEKKLDLLDDQLLKIKESLVLLAPLRQKEV